jgi:hypothetical protein
MQASANDVWMGNLLQLFDCSELLLAMLPAVCRRCGVGRKSRVKPKYGASHQPCRLVCFRREREESSFCIEREDYNVHILPRFKNLSGTSTFLHLTHSPKFFASVSIPLPLLYPRSRWFLIKKCTTRKFFISKLFHVVSSLSGKHC